jgi:UDP-glucose:(heptosyl)LPS alpha-1,3-glucosyltransferase
VLLGIEERVFADPSQWVLCNSEMVRDEIAGRYGVPEDRLPVIPNGVDLERFRPDPAPPVRATLRADLGATDERVWLLVGSGFRRKGVDTALHALAAATDSRAQLWVVGRDEPGPWRRLAENLGVAGRVRWLGSREDMPDVYAGADALLLPTRYDAFANVCLEAAASGLPVVTSGANGAAGWLGPVALVVEDPEDAAGFAKALDILDDPRQREELGRAARARAEQASWESHVEALHELYSRIRN